MTWRVLTWNILGARNPSLAVIAMQVRRRDPDVLALQEVRRNQAKHLAQLLGWHYVWTLKHYPLTPLMWWRAEGLALLAPTPLSDTRSHVLSRRSSTWTYHRRVMLAATLERDAQRMRTSNLHLSTTGPDHRIDQARRAADFIAAASSGAGALQVVCGDMNAADELEAIREFHAVGVRDTGGDATNPSRAPFQRLDYVLVPQDAIVSVVETPEGGDEWAQLSDHLPVLVEFTYEEG
ncbi:MAG: endonuclease/exonuclease/phosphatase family protein [Actinobacteria bacterium]|nr:endonuclease/exonuclease/phosphatase family protein [Actinomycetota bacterium]